MCVSACQQIVGGVEVREALLCKNSVHNILEYFIKEYFKRLAVQDEMHVGNGKCVGLQKKLL